MQNRTVPGLVVLAAVVGFAESGRSDSRGRAPPGSDSTGPAWHDQWHRGHWVGGGSDWGGPWAWGFSWHGPNAAEYYNPFCGRCQPFVLNVVQSRRSDRVFRFGGGLQAPNEGGEVERVESVVIDYSRPLDATAYAEPGVNWNRAVGAPLVSGAARAAVGSARAAFYGGDYNLALQYTNAALVRMPRDLAIHETRALCLFALKRYGEAATTLNALLAVGPGWNWTTMSGFYPNVEAYTSQLRALEAYSKSNPRSADGHFLLAYHYATGGYPDAAVKQLQQVVDLVPRASVAARLMQQLAAPAETDSAAPGPASSSAPGGQSAGGAAVNVPQLIGTWKAALPDGTKFTMKLDAGSNFTWAFNRRGVSTTMSGTYTRGRDTLTLKERYAGTLTGTVTFAPDGALKFKTPSAPDGEEELDFHR
ncbi:MAG: tetratricopeptide repeat protein [Deltaproteobacteria bacterium]